MIKLELKRLGTGSVGFLIPKFYAKQNGFEIGKEYDVSIKEAKHGKL